MNAIYYTDKNVPICLDKEIGRGGEGPVYSIQGSPSECAKIYSKKLSVDDHEKLRLMVNNPPLDPSYSSNKHRSIAWPSAILYADAKKTQFAGLIMPKIDLKIFKKAIVYLSPDDRRQQYFGSVTWLHLFVVARNISSAIAAIHERGYCLGDINESNILVAPDGLITFIDCDSFQVRDNGKIYRCLVGKDDYSAPELQGKSFSDIDRTFETDAFALGVLTFQLLMEGFHPFSGRWLFSGDPPRIQDKILRGLYPYGRKLNELVPQPDAPSFDIIHPNIQSLFDRCFVDGHGNPKKRPSAKEWLKTLDGLMAKFRICSKNENHRYFEQLHGCPWCNYDKDSFPGYSGHQISLVNPTKPIQTLEERIDYLQTYIDMALSDGVMSRDERDYIFDIALKLQIPKKEIERVLDAEIKKWGVKNATSNVGISPKLELSQRTQFDFQNLRIDSLSSGKFTISNVGGGVLTGAIKPNKKWLRVSQDNIDINKHKQDIELCVDTTGLPFGLRDAGFIEIQSNGGTEKVAVSISIEEDLKDLGRFRKGMTVTALILGGLLGFIIYYFPCYARGSGFYDFTYYMALISTMIMFYRSGSFFVEGIIGAGLFLIVGSLFSYFFSHIFFAFAWALIYGTSANLSANRIRRTQWQGDKSIQTIAITTASVVTISLIIAGSLISRKEATATTAEVSPPQVASNDVPQRPSNSSANTAMPQDNSRFTVNKIDTNPSGANVFIDDQQRGRTPLYDVSLDGGRPHKIRFEKAGYKTDWDIIDDGQTELDVLTLWPSR